MHGELRSYPEKPNRFDRLLDVFRSDERIEILAPHLIAARDQLQQVHTAAYLDHLEQASQQVAEPGNYQYPDIFPIRPGMDRLKASPSEYNGFYSLDPYAPIGKGTSSAAFEAANVAISAAGCLRDQKAGVVYALCRPPGHHAGRDYAGGYCYLNNAALAANHLRTSGRVAILDVDYHHGNGTQEIFWNSPDVLYVSLHGDPSFEYPYYTGYSSETGGAEAPGANLNLPLPRGTVGDEYLAALDEGVAAIRSFAPAYLVVSAGFDTHHADLFSTFDITTEDFTRIAMHIQALKMPTLLVQEGGYNLDTLPRLAAAFVAPFLHP